MSSQLVTTAHLQANSEVARDKLIRLFSDITDYSLLNEKDGVLRYVTALPLDPTDETSVYMFEHYRDKDASDAHFKTPPVQVLIKYFQSESPLACPPRIFNLTPAVVWARQGDGGAILNMLLAMITIRLEGSSSTAIVKLVGDAVEQTKHEDQLQACIACENKADSEIRVIEVVRESAGSEDRGDGVGVRSSIFTVYQRLKKQLPASQIGLVTCRIEQGFLARGERRQTSL